MGKSDLRVYHEYAYYPGRAEAPLGADYPPSVKVKLSFHRYGDRLPRGKSFDKHRHLEATPSKDALGGYIVHAIREALSKSLGNERIPSLI